MTERFLVWGNGGHGRVVYDTVQAAGGLVVGFIDRDAGSGRVTLPDGTTLPLLDETAIVGSRLPLDARAVALGIGSNTDRLACFDRVGEDRCPVVSHPSVIRGSGTRLGAGTVIMPRVVVNAGAQVGRAVIINSGVVVEHDCWIGDGSHLSPGAVLCGGVRLEARAWIGAGATIIPNVLVGADSVVGAGSVVTRDVPPGSTVAGCPAKPIR